MMFLLGSWVHLKVMSDLYSENHCDLTFDFDWMTLSVGK